MPIGSVSLLAGVLKERSASSLQCEGTVWRDSVRDGKDLKEKMHKKLKLNHIPALPILTTQDFCQSFKA